jgi:hypothetical protein
LSLAVGREPLDEVEVLRLAERFENPVVAEVQEARALHGDDISKPYVASYTGAERLSGEAQGQVGDEPMWLTRVQRRLSSECDRLTSRLLSRSLAAFRDFSGLPLALFAHGVYDQAPANPSRFPTKNFMPVRELRAEVEWLRHRGYHFVGFGELLRYLRGEADAPARAVHLMFDDGYRSVYEHAFPALQELDVPFSVAVVETFVRQGRLLWFDDLHCRIQACSERIPEINRLAPDVLRVDAFDAAACRVVYGMNRLKLVADTRRREILDAISTLCPLEDALVSEYLRPLNDEQIREMRKRGVVFLAHSRSHPILSGIEGAGSLRDEVANWDPQMLEPGCLVIPDGKVTELSPRVANGLRDTGIAFAFSTMSGFIDRNAPPLGLSRVSMQGGLKDLRARLATVELDHLRSLKNYPHGGQSPDAGFEANRHP